MQAEPSLESVKHVIQQYHLLSDQGESGKTARSLAIEEIEQIFCMAWLPGYEFDRRLTMSGSEKNNKPRPTAKVIQALHDYHLELDTNGITVITEGKAIALIEQALNMPWKKGEELAREG